MCNIGLKTNKEIFIKSHDRESKFGLFTLPKLEDSHF